MNETPPSLLGLTTYLMSKTGKAARGRLADRLAERGLRLWHMAVLAALTDFGPHVQRELAERLSIDRSDVVKIVDGLGAAGLVDRARDTADRRRVTVTVTPAGRALLESLKSDALAVQEEVLAPLTARERAQLTALLLRVHEGARESGQARAGR
ncbi:MULTISPECIES: MarR family winged helix-turn-helix transcriptional regulator [unclassified Streptomyces]|uniref:MarR family winged helix-turn-helix transcriptional regulator n=1 Tax=unclassified Streptomyces TaxID=2593676 RepID=UPI002E28DB6F|nr:MarR family winged helix-turn-helix transcriptional regulator [Streptomyces sp. NBC_01423]WSX94931.1 MarR family winged helix-turn-helix transcriptional regulator [Streptomyces sp. NBC_00891]WSY09411.1 MarR family winged helix-turn-helix transcriptional regulator [Streptomyces sp. NBC_00890]WSZ11032.1 MarR family winged helix-turn-helix transcriptional regulator [Streptomyces sp. NBC_00869]WSZ21463.1 MarR family winged helix-turn-helix transcriptional regulator [Streptomyces sp. NBC_00870]